MNPVNSNKLVRVSVLNKPDMIHLGYNLTQHIASDVLANVSVSNYVIVTDAHLAQLYLEPLMKALQAEMNKEVSSSNKNNKKRLLVRILPPGELSKSRQTKQDLEDFLLSQACTRDTCLLALGGGVIGDLVGFVAATFMRGIPVVQIPTTLLAMVDSSIGGKTAIDTLHGKNLIGSFWQPERIYMDLATLQTLPKREFSNGMAEVIKTAAIWNQTDFSRLEKNRVEMQEAIQSAGNRCNQDDDDVAQDILMQAILASVRVKAHVVSNDEREGGLRGLLNFGHTLGHAIEAILAPEWLHGECVAIGMILEAEISVALGYCESAGVVDRLKNCIASYGLPTDCSTIRDRVFVPDVMCVMKIDKKNQGTQKRIVLLSCIGATFESRPTNVPDAVILDVLHRHFAPSTSSTTVVDQVPCSPTPDAAASAPSCCLPSLVLASSNNYFSEWIKGILLPAALDQGPLKNYRLVKELSDKYNQVAVVDNLETAEESLQSGQGIILIWFTFEAGTTSLDPALEWYEYVVVPCDDGSAAAETFQVPAALAFFEKMLGIRSRQVTLDKASCFVTPTIPDYAAVPPHLLEQWVEGADAIELRVDLLEMKQSSSSFSCWVTTAGKQLAHLRSRTKLPVIFTVRTVPQAGKFDPSLIQDVYMQLLYWAHRWACEYIDIEFTTISPQQLESLANVNEKNSNYSRWIASFHDPDRLYPWSSQQLQSIYERAANVVPNKNKNAVIKLVGYAKSFADNIELEQFRQCVDPDRSKEIILINMGEYGRFSRVANYFLTPATHSTLPSAAAPGQLTIQELGYLRSALKLQHST